jgi:hypothetical protein
MTSLGIEPATFRLVAQFPLVCTHTKKVCILFVIKIWKNCHYLQHQMQRHLTHEPVSLAASLYASSREVFGSNLCWDTDLWLSSVPPRKSRGKHLDYVFTVSFQILSISSIILSSHPMWSVIWQSRYQTNMFHKPPLFPLIFFRCIEVVIYRNKD